MGGFTEILKTLVPVAASTISGGLANRGQKTTTKSRTKKILDPTQVQAQGLLSQQMQSQIANPSAGLEPFRAAAVSGVNRNYAALPGRLETSLASRGFGRGGQLRGGLRQIELSRQGDLAGVENNFQQQAIGERDKGISIAQQLLSQINEQESEGTNTTPSNVLGGAVSQGLETYTTLQALQKALAGGSGGNRLFSPRPRTEG